VPVRVADEARVCCFGADMGWISRRIERGGTSSAIAGIVQFLWDSGGFGCGERYLEWKARWRCDLWEMANYSIGSCK